MKNILIVSYAYIAALIGAGFASGQEILCYFISFGRAGFLGVMISAVLFALFAYIILKSCILSETSDFDTFMQSLPGKRIRKILKTATGIFSFAVYLVMLAAIGEIGFLILGAPQNLVTLAAALLCPILYWHGTGFVFKLNGLIGLILVIGISVCCMYILCYRELHTFSQSLRVPSNAFIYSGYNLISVTPVLISMSRRLRSRGEAAAVSIISGAVLFFLMTLIFLLLSMYANRIDLGEFPMLTLAYRQNKIFAMLYGAVLAGAVITTLLSSCGSIVETFSLNNRPVTVLLLSVTAYALSGLGFSRLVDTAYRICGILGFLLVFYLMIVSSKKFSNSCNFKSIHQN